MKFSDVKLGQTLKVLENPPNMDRRYPAVGSLVVVETIHPVQRFPVFVRHKEAAPEIATWYRYEPEQLEVVE